MLKKVISYSGVVFLIFSLLPLVVIGQFKEGTCKNPAGGTYCGASSKVSNCYCDTMCTQYKDCCSDYQEACTSVS